jgi:hypothetical protein
MTKKSLIEIFINHHKPSKDNLPLEKIENCNKFVVELARVTAKRLELHQGEVRVKGLWLTDTH